ncbi:MAG: hypothetical protein R3360_04300 [Alphaproteobacteria bacterium]|nr:hypothetical protein [Alphaproteobacteria bacterium]
MTPEPDKVLYSLLMKSAAERGGRQIAKDDYEGNTQALMGLIMLLTAQEYDRAADIRVKENERMRALFADLAPRLEDASLKTRVEEAAALEDEKFTITALNRTGHRLKDVLIDLHSHIEQQGADWAKEADARIWSLMEQSVKSRTLILPQLGG